MDDGIIYETPLYLGNTLKQARIERESLARLQADNLRLQQENDKLLARLNATLRPLGDWDGDGEIR